MRKRPPKPIDQSDQNRIIAALERFPDKEGFVGYRTRAFIYLLWDGALRAGAALTLNIEDVVEDPTGSQIHVVEEPVSRSPKDKGGARRFVMSHRARAAMSDYLRQARDGGWLASGDRMAGPLWIASYPVGSQTRMSRRTAMHAWKTFLAGLPAGLSDYQLDDVVMTGRAAFAAIANGSPELISQHTGISTKAAARYVQHVPSRLSSPREVMSELNSTLMCRP